MMGDNLWSMQVDSTRSPTSSLPALADSPGSFCLVPFGSVGLRNVRKDAVSATLGAIVCTETIAPNGLYISYIYWQVLRKRIALTQCCTHPNEINFVQYGLSDDRDYR